MSCTKSHVVFAACIHLWAGGLDAWLSKVCKSSAQVQTAYAAYLCSDGVMDGQTGGRTDTQTDRQTDRQTEKLMSECCTHLHLLTLAYKLKVWVAFAQVPWPAPTGREG